MLEQIKQQPCCWTPRGDGLVDPTLNKFNFAGICSRYLDSNGYSLRNGGEDLGSRFRLSLRQSGNSLKLQALNPRQGGLYRGWSGNDSQAGSQRFHSDSSTSILEG